MPLLRTMCNFSNIKHPERSQHQQEFLEAEKVLLIFLKRIYLKGVMSAKLAS